MRLAACSFAAAVDRFFLVINFVPSCRPAFASFSVLRSLFSDLLFAPSSLLFSFFSIYFSFSLQSPPVPACPDLFTFYLIVEVFVSIFFLSGRRGCSCQLGDGDPQKKSRHPSWPSRQTMWDARKLSARGCLIAGKEEGLSLIHI